MDIGNYQKVKKKMSDNKETYENILKSLIFLTKGEYKYIDCSEIEFCGLRLNKVLFDLSNLLCVKERGILVAVSNKQDMKVVGTRIYGSEAISFIYDKSNLSKEENEYIEKLDQIDVDSDSPIDNQTQKILVDTIKSKAKVSQINEESKHFLIACDEQVYLLYREFVENCAYDLGLENKFEMDEFLNLVKHASERYKSFSYEMFLKKKNIIKKLQK